MTVENLVSSCSSSKNCLFKIFNVWVSLSTSKIFREFALSSILCSSYMQMRSNSCLYYLLSCYLCCLDSPKILLHPCHILRKCTIVGGSNTNHQFFEESRQHNLLYSGFITHPWQISIYLPSSNFWFWTSSTIRALSEALFGILSASSNAASFSTYFAFAKPLYLSVMLQSGKKVDGNTKQNKKVSSKMKF